MAALVSKVVEDPLKPELERFTVDREKSCPLLLRVFCNLNHHHHVNEFNRGNTPSGELQIYTWMDCSLKELTSLIKEVNPDARRKGTFFDFAIVYPEQRTPTYRMVDIGSTCAGRKGADDDVTLNEKKYTVGDYVDVSIVQPSGGPGGGPPRAGPPSGLMRGGPRRPF